MAQEWGRGCSDSEDLYNCNGYVGCCSVNPCQYVDFDDPCAEAEEYGDNGDEGTTKTTTASATTTRVSSTHKSTTLVTTTVTKPSPTSPDSDGSSSAESSGSTSSHSTPTSADSTGTPTTGTLGATDSITNTAATPTSSSTASPTATPIDGTGNTGLGSSATIGIAAGTAVAGLAVLALLFWLIRRRRLSKRMSSLRGGSPDGNGAMSKRNRTPSLTGTAVGMNAFGGSGEGQTQNNVPETWPLAAGTTAQYQNQNYEQQGNNNLMYSQPPQPMYANHSHASGLPSPMSPQGQRDFAELDSPPLQSSYGGPRPSPRPIVTTSPSDGMMSMPMPMPQSQSQSSIRSTDGRVHPPTLTPGHLGTQMSIQSRSMSDTNMSVSSYHEEHDQSQNWDQNQNKDQGRHEQQQEQQQQQKQEEDGDDSATLRATLNATEHERQNNLYPNSWAQI